MRNRTENQTLLKRVLTMTGNTWPVGSIRRQYCRIRMLSVYDASECARKCSKGQRNKDDAIRIIKVEQTEDCMRIIVVIIVTVLRLYGFNAHDVSGLRGDRLDDEPWIGRLKCCDLEDTNANQRTG